MIARRTLRALVLTAAVGISRVAGAAAPREVKIVGARVHVGDVVPSVDASIAGVDLGPSPVAGCSRIISREDIVTALEARQLPSPSDIPSAVRVLRQSKHVIPADIETLVRDAVGDKALRHGVALDAVRAEHPIDVVDGWTRVGVDVPRAPRKVGAFSTVAVLSFYGAEDEVLARIPVPVDLSVSPEGATPEAKRGAAVTLVIRRSLVEVRVGAFAGADADVGDPVPIQLRPSGRVIRAHLVSKDEALADVDAQ